MTLNFTDVNNELYGDDWVAVEDRVKGFSLYQVQTSSGVPEEDFDTAATTDALPVISASRVAEGIRFVLDTVDKNDPARFLVLATKQSVAVSIIPKQVEGQPRTEKPLVAQAA